MIHGRRRRVAVWLSILALLCASAAAPAAEREPEVALAVGPIDVLGPGPHFLNLAAGVFDFRKVGGEVTHDRGPRAEGRIELYSGWKLFAIGPMVGLLANHDGGVYGWGGTYMDVAWARWRVTPAVGLGGYRQGDSKVLGGVFEFYAGGTITYELDGGSRFGILLSHLSNARIHDENPGTESLLLTWMVPF